MINSGCLQTKKNSYNLRLHHRNNSILFCIDETPPLFIKEDSDKLEQIEKANKNN